MKLPFSFLASAAAVLFGASLAAHADVTLEHRMTVQGAGMMRMANMTGTSVTTISGERSRTQSSVRFESGLMRTFARGASGDTIEIVDLPQDKLYELDPKKKTYTESTFAEKRAQLQKAVQQMQEGQAAQSRGTSGVDESQCEWLPAKSEVKRTGEKSNIAGYDAEHVIVTASQPCKDKSTGQICEFGLTFDNWLAPGFKESTETLHYQQAYAQKLGLNASGSRDFAERAQAMFGRYEGIWKEIAVKMADMKGYPVKSSFALGVGGAQCQSAQQAQSSGGAQGSASVGGAVLQGLGGMFGRKKNAEPQPAAAPASSNGFLNLMTVGTELVTVKTDAAPAGSFEIPAGFKRVTE